MLRWPAGVHARARAIPLAAVVHMAATSAQIVAPGRWRNCHTCRRGRGVCRQWNTPGHLQSDSNPRAPTSAGMPSQLQPSEARAMEAANTPSSAAGSGHAADNAAAQSYREQDNGQACLQFDARQMEHGRREQREQERAKTAHMQRHRTTALCQQDEVEDNACSELTSPQPSVHGMRLRYGGLSQMWNSKAPRWLEQLLAADDPLDDGVDTPSDRSTDTSCLTSSRVSWLNPKFSLQAAKGARVYNSSDSAHATCPKSKKRVLELLENKGTKRRKHRGRHDNSRKRRTKLSVSFEALSPVRVYVADAAMKLSDSARLRAEELRTNPGLRFAQFGRLDSTTGLRYAPVECKYAGDIKVAKQIKRMIKNPFKVKENVGIFKITDREHPAFIGRKSDDHPPYGAMALKNLPSRKVLGAYGGVTKLDMMDDLDRSADRADCQFALHVDHLFVDADKCCNELAFFNDYRTDTTHYRDPERQEGYYKCKGKAKNTRHNTEVLIAWKQNELLPRVFFITNRAVQANEELMIDYGDAYWKSIDDLRESDSATSDGEDQTQECNPDLGAALVSTSVPAVSTAGSEASLHSTGAALGRSQSIHRSPSPDIGENVVGDVLNSLVRTVVDNNGGTSELWDASRTSVQVPYRDASSLESESESEIDLTGDTPSSSDDEMVAR